MIKTRTALLILLALSAITAAQNKFRDDKGPDLRGKWPTIMTLYVLQDAGLLDSKLIDPSRTETTLLGSETVGKNLWNQFYFVSFRMRNGSTVQAIARVNASPIKDMRSGPVVYVISKILNPEGKPLPGQ
jgi:hypothetical protein